MKVLQHKIVTLTHPDRPSLKVSSRLEKNADGVYKLARVKTTNLWDKPTPGFPDRVSVSMLSALTQALDISRTLESEGYSVSGEDVHYVYPDKPTNLCSSVFQYASSSFDSYDQWSRSSVGVESLSKSVLSVTKDPISYIADIWKDSQGTFESDHNESLLRPPIVELNSISAELSKPVRSISVGFVDLHPCPWRIIDVIPSEGFSVLDALISMTKALPFTPDRALLVPRWFYGDEIFEALESPSLQSHLLISRPSILADALVSDLSCKWVSRFGDFPPPPSHFQSTVF